MVNYIIDESGNKTHVIVPINEWEKITDADDRIGSIINDYEIKSIIPSLIHSKNILNTINKPTFLKALTEEYKYINSASSSEVGLMYLLRTPEFAEYILRTNADEENIKRFSSDFYITDLQGIPISLDKAVKFRSIIIENPNPAQLLKEFRIFYNIGVKNNKKRIRRDVDIKRLFIFDVLENFPRVFPDLVVSKDELALSLYPDNTKESAMAQLNKAYREAKDRIYSNQWIEYIGK